MIRCAATDCHYYSNKICKTLFHILPLYSLIFYFVELFIFYLYILYNIYNNFANEYKKNLSKFDKFSHLFQLRTMFNIKAFRSSTVFIKILMNSGNSIINSNVCRLNITLSDRVIIHSFPSFFCIRHQIS